jgi:hypothetical protein
VVTVHEKRAARPVVLLVARLAVLWEAVFEIVVLALLHLLRKKLNSLRKKARHVEQNGGENKASPPV